MIDAVILTLAFGFWLYLFNRSLYTHTFRFIPYTILYVEVIIAMQLDVESLAMQDYSAYVLKMTALLLCGTMSYALLYFFFIQKQYMKRLMLLHSVAVMYFMVLIFELISNLAGFVSQLTLFSISAYVEWILAALSLLVIIPYGDFNFSFLRHGLYNHGHTNSHTKT